jgi:hypothetical protein
MTVEAIKDAIAELSEPDRESLTAWLNSPSYDDWDRQMAADFRAGGRGEALFERVRGQIAEGLARPIEARSDRERR